MCFNTPSSNLRGTYRGVKLPQSLTRLFIYSWVRVSLIISSGFSNRREGVFVQASVHRIKRSVREGWPGHRAAFSCVYAARWLDHPPPLNQALSTRWSPCLLPSLGSGRWCCVLCTCPGLAGTRQTLSQNAALRLESWAIFQVNIPNFPQLQIELQPFLKVGVKVHWDHVCLVLSTWRVLSRCELCHHHPHV